VSAASAKVDLSALAHNVSAIREMVEPAMVCAVVKADGYGHGAPDVAAAAIAAGASWLGVATAAEAVELAEGSDARFRPAPILILSQQPESELRRLWPRLPQQIRLVVATEAGARLVDSLATRPVPVHMMVDTGMHRMGADPSRASDLADHLASSPNLIFEGVLTHLAVADDPDDSFTAVQIERFDEVLASLAEAGHHPAVIHMANSAAAMTRRETRRDMVRLGIAMYGSAPSAALDGLVDLRPVMSLSSEVSALRTVGAGESVSYGRRWFAGTPTRIATVPIGYADGIRRDSAAAGVEVLIGGRRRPIVGVVTMDQLMVAVDDTVSVGDEVVLIGEQGRHTVSASEIADRLDTIAYEVLVALGGRILRRVIP